MSIPLCYHKGAGAPIANLQTPEAQNWFENHSHCRYFSVTCMDKQIDPRALPSHTPYQNGLRHLLDAGFLEVHHPTSIMPYVAGRHKVPLPSAPRLDGST